VTVATYGDGDGGLFVEVVRGSGAARRQLVRAEQDDHQQRYPGITFTDTTAGDLVLECTALPATAAPVSSTCTWNDGDTAGVVFGYGVGTQQLAELGSTARAVIAVKQP
jgi:hypothetical protein